MLNSTKTYCLYATNIFAVIVTLLLSSCNQQTHSVDYYLAYQEEMRAKVKECENNSKSKNDQNCQNAMQATFKASMNVDNMPKIK